jgi:hypothetical protein
MGLVVLTGNESSGLGPLLRYFYRRQRQVWCANEVVRFVPPRNETTIGCATRKPRSPLARAEQAFDSTTGKRRPEETHDDSGRAETIVQRAQSSRQKAAARWV